MTTQATEDGSDTNSRANGSVNTEASQVASNKLEGAFKSKTATYVCWTNMKQRCTNPNSTSWRNYGKRGIKVCKRWFNSFDEFYKDMGSRPEGKTIDRVDNDGNYEPGNCRWASPQTQVRNQRHPKSKTGYSGVSRQYNDKYTAYITLNRKNIYFGTYPTIEEAAEVSRKAKEKYYVDN